MIFYRIIILLLFVLLPLKCYGITVNDDIKINSIKDNIVEITKDYDNKKLTLNEAIENLNNNQKGSGQKGDSNTSTNSSTTGDLQKKIEELQQKLDETTKQYESQLNELKVTLEELKKEQQSLKDKYDIQQTLEETTTTVPEPQETPPPRQTSQSTNPDISAIGDIMITNDDPPGNNKAFIREVEVGIQAVVDSYARGDFFLSYDGDEDKIGVEEGYITLLDLPGSLQSKIGKFRANFGKANRTHRPEYYMSTYPNVLKNYLGEEGLASTGVNINFLLPTSTYAEVSGEVFTGGNGTSFAENDNYIYLGHGKTFFDLNENNSLELGATYASGKNDVENNLRTHLIGFDVTYRWDPTDNDEHAFMLQSEVIYSKRDILGLNDALNSCGYYVFGQYKLSKRWYLGMRYDYSEFPDDNTNNEKAYSLCLSFWPSEFSRFRLQYTHTDRTFGDPSDGIYFQTTFTLGPHRPHPF